ncbi:MAG: hotdog domain-containing protein [Actinomycetota bacterium]
MALEAGASAADVFAVEPEHLATAFGSGDVEVLSTPQLLAWCEQMTVRSVEGQLEPDQTTVGMRMRIDHVSPSTVGGRVAVAARLTLVEGRRLTFDVSARDGDREILLGQVVRVVVTRDRFMARVREITGTGDL